MTFIFDELTKLSNQYLDSSITAIECADEMAALFQKPMAEHELRDFAQLMSELAKLEEE